MTTRIRKSLLSIPVIVVVVGIVLVLAAGTTAEGQQGQFFATPPNDTKIIDQDVIKTRISTGLIQSELTDYRLYGDGKGEFTFRIAPGGTGNRTFTVMIDHPYGTAQGYIYNSTGVYTQDGSQRLVIATTTTPPTGR